MSDEYLDGIMAKVAPTTDDLIKQAEECIEFLSKQTHGPCRTCKLIRQLIAKVKEREGWVLVPVERLLAARDAHIKDDFAEAYHQLYMCAHETTENKNFPWAHWETMIAASKEKP